MRRGQPRHDDERAAAIFIEGEAIADKRQRQALRQRAGAAEPVTELIEAARLGLIEPILVAPEARIRAVAAAAGPDISALENADLD